MDGLDVERRKRVFYRSVHRGCKEMDILLGDFVRRYMHLLNDEWITRYEKIMELDDRLLYSYIVGSTSVPADVDIKLIRLIAESASLKGKSKEENGGIAASTNSALCLN